jgi:hypothetical protein
MKKKILLTGAALLAAFVLLKTLNYSTTQIEADEEYMSYFNQNYKIFALDVPEEMSFAGERVPLEMVDIRERMDRELLVNTYWQSQTLLLHKRANRWFPVIEPILKEEGVPDDFKYLAIAESGLTQIVSPAGATGFWQFMKGTAIEYGLEVRDGVDERYNVEKATRAACEYLKKAKEDFGNWTMAAAVYNYGKSNVNKQIARQKALNYYDLLLNEETARYMFRIMAMKEVLSSPNKYGFHFRPKDLYPPYETIQIEVNTAIPDMADFASEYGLNYKVLKTLNPWLRDNKMSNPKKRTYQIKIPANGFDGFKSSGPY